MVDALTSALFGANIDTYPNPPKGPKSEVIPVAI